MGEILIMPLVRRIEIRHEEPKPQWRWFALKVAPGREFVAERMLRDDGFDVFVPLKHIRGKTKRKDQRTIIPRPKLNGYVFIGFDRFDIPWLDVMRFRMIHGVISDGGAPYALPEPQIRKLVVWSSRPMRYINAPFGRRKRRKRPNARIISGPYADREIRYVEIAKEVELYELVEPHLVKSAAV
jgi:transcription antitermination factor NusG